MITVRLAPRPLRIGFVVTHDDFDGLWKAVRYNTCLWGGLNNPIIPVRDGVDNPPLADYLVRTFDVDLLHPVSDGEVSKAFVEARDHLKWPLGQDLASDEGTEHEHLTLLDVKPILRGLSTNTSRDSRWAIPALPLDGWRANLVKVMCGDPDGTELGGATFRSAYARDVGASEHIIREGVPLPLHLVSALWPIHVSTVGLERFRPRHGWSNPGVYVGDATDFDDLVSFWNLRAAGNAVMFLPTQAVTDAMPLARAHAERVGRTGADPWDGPTVWHLRNRHDPVVAEVKQSLGVGEHPFDA